ncbi:hypothetical protein DH2020_043583 [Rehmannia glutinosa]|uniref:CRAL-TRIO domain-containing protein n=1 Tax=Rehmannia glutinosa TaxID=99300 RepID=A0ABR0UJQ4_REHGL
MGKKDGALKDKQRFKSVIDLLNKQSPLTLQQEKFCNEDCVERFLKAKGDNVKKAAKHLRNCLSWRHSIGTDNLIADEFCAELAEGVAYVAGHDDELRPFVLLFDASFFRSASAFMNMLLVTLKIIADYYPLRLYKAFIIDPPSLFSYLWKGVRLFVELSSLTTIVLSIDFEELLEFNNFMTSSYSRTTSRRFDPSSTPSAAKLGTCSSSRFSFTVSHHFDSLKPWYLSLKDTSESKLGRTNITHAFLGPTISPLNARSFSFSSPMTRKSFFPSTPMPRSPKTRPVYDPPSNNSEAFIPPIAIIVLFERIINQIESREITRIICALFEVLSTAI